MIPGSLIKLVYFSRSGGGGRRGADGLRNDAILDGRLHFVRFETSKINDCLEFVKSKLQFSEDDLGPRKSSARFKSIIKVCFTQFPFC